MPGLLLGARVRQQAAATPAPGPAAGAVRFCVRFFRLASTFPQFCSSRKPQYVIDLHQYTKKRHRKIPGDSRLENETPEIGPSGIA